MGEELVLKVSKKNADYGSAFEQINKMLLILFPDGIPPSKFRDATILIRMLDKVCRIANNNPKFFPEDSWDDIGGYALVAKVSHQKDKLTENSTLQNGT